MYSSMWQKMHVNPAHQYPEIAIYHLQCLKIPLQHKATRGRKYRHNMEDMIS